MIGQKCGRWLVVAYAGHNKHGRRMWLCKCECGTTRVCNGDDLKGGRSKSCGCFMRESVAKRALRHGMSLTPVYKVWADMKRRCLNKNTPEWADYGGRGIALCDSWHDFQNFYKDMGDRPFKGATLDRVDNEGNYEPSNCAWVSNKENNRHKRDSKYLTHNGETMCMSAWAEKLGIIPATLKGRVRRGWTVERALDTGSPHVIL